jgi:hypothetical protein
MSESPRLSPLLKMGLSLLSLCLIIGFTGWTFVLAGSLMFGLGLVAGLVCVLFSAAGFCVCSNWLPRRFVLASLVFVFAAGTMIAEIKLRLFEPLFGGEVEPLAYLFMVSGVINGSIIGISLSSIYGSNSSTQKQKR